MMICRYIKVYFYVYLMCCIPILYINIKVYLHDKWVHHISIL